MPETIIYNQFEYILGATVGPAGGTGATMFATISGLSGNTRYEFILLTYNAIGSTIIGPIGVTTMYGEPRESINAWGGLPYGLFYGGPSSYESGNTVNYVVSSTDFTHPVWGGSTSKTSGYTAPDGSTTAFKIDNPYLLQNLYIPLGHTYIYSYYMNVTQSNTATLRVDAYYIDGGKRLKFRQLLPTEQPTASVMPYISIPNDGITGWRRFAFEFYTTEYPLLNNQHLYFTFIYYDNPSGKSIYYWGPQVEKIS